MRSLLQAVACGGVDAVAHRAAVRRRPAAGQLLRPRAAPELRAGLRKYGYLSFRGYPCGIVEWSCSLFVLADCNTTSLCAVQSCLVALFYGSLAIVFSPDPTLGAAWPRSCGLHI
jgi:hypothetical protein